MPQQSEPTPARGRGAARREGRANRILDAAAALILRWGYNKTTIDDIARQAGVAKGTIYLHWNTREELFAALMKRERAELALDFKQRVDADPTGWALRSMLKHSALALVRRPLLKAVFLGDMEVLGKLARSEHTSAAYRERLAGFQIYLQFLREHDQVRTDLSLDVQVYMLSAIFTGFFLVAPLMPAEFTVPDEQLADLIAETIHRTLESSRPVAADELHSISQAFGEYMNRALARAQYQHEVE